MRRIIEGIRIESLGAGGNLGHIEALVACASFAGLGLEEQAAVALSGEAWRLYDMADAADISAAHAGTEHSVVQALIQFGFEYEHCTGMGPDDCFDLARRAVDAGHPALGRNTEGLDMWGVIAGYDAGARTILCHNIRASEIACDEANPAEMAGPGGDGGEAVVVRAPARALDERQALLDAIADGVHRFLGAGRTANAPGTAVYEATAARISEVSFDSDAVSHNVETWGRMKPWMAEYLAGALDGVELTLRYQLERAAEQLDLVGRNWDALRWQCGWGQEGALDDEFKRRRAVNILRDAMAAEARAMDELRSGLIIVEDELVASGRARCDEPGGWFAHQCLARRLSAVGRYAEADEQFAQAASMRAAGE